ncbi:hypothetical protein P6166_04735 [Stenotrophomonas sp. HITSZ_GD]|uniref:hypothetical protein n=1 Tax=Stenotrophomonas sp. HITSZ_GD TaxID=3037248 RepID=UPI00240D4706|nr:hypothetical protein [Stenotrophomonas sp. HITSZ_GD]MDG2524664.1 hypothetical protein [Stenotrophomonas sp. HITSZ_GD]
MDLPNLPPGFQWRPWGTELHLHLDGRGIGLIVELPEGRGCRVSRNDGTTNLRFEFLPSRDASVRFLERWAVRWEERIREQYRGLGCALPEERRTGVEVQTTHRRRRRR